MLLHRRALFIFAATLTAFGLLLPERLFAQDVSLGNCIDRNESTAIARLPFHAIDPRAPAHPPTALYRASGLGRGTILVAPSNTAFAAAFAATDSPTRVYAFTSDVPYSGDAHYSGPPVLPVWTDKPIDVAVWTHAGQAPAECLSAVAAREFRTRTESLVLFIYLGSLAALLLFNLALAVTSREPITGWYCVYLASLLFYQMVRDDMPWRWFVPAGPIPENLLEFSAFLFNLTMHAQFGRAFLQTRRYLKRYDALLLAYIVLLGAYFVYIFAADRLGALHYGQQPPIVLALIFFVAATLIAAAIARLRAGYQPALLFLISYPWLFFFTLLAVMHWATGIGGPIVTFSAEIGTLGEAIILSFAVGFRLRNERELREFVASLAPKPGRGSERPRELHVAIMQGCVLHHGVPLDIASREFELLAALVIGERAPSRNELQEMLWPELPSDAAENALDVALSRLRKRLGYRTAARSTRGGVVLDPLIAVDVRDARDALADSDVRIDELERACDAFARPLPVPLLAWDWFVERSVEIEHLRRDLLLKLIGRYETRGDVDVAIAAAHRLQQLDPTDESGYAAAMRLYRRKNDFGGVERSFRDCCRSLKQHLGVEPSVELRRLLGNTARREGNAPAAEVTSS